MKTSKHLKLTMICGLMLTVVCQSQAVQVSQQGTGEVLIYPYYTVNNDLNTLYSVVNTTADTKAIKVSFLEGDIGKHVLTFNVYLSAFDVWTGALVPTLSTIGGHVGEPTATHVTSDTSCAPFLVKAGQEFLPFEIDLDIDPENRNMQRSTEGHIEIIEMGVMTAQGVAWADHGVVGVPASCASIDAEWSDNGQWDISTLDDPSGGLYGTGTLVNVAEGIAFSYDAIALQNFWKGPGMHTEPGWLLPNLNAAWPESKVLLDSGELVTAEWNQGYEAVSAVLTKTQIFNEFALDTIIAGKSEWVMNFPTKKFHTDPEALTAPFVSPWDGRYACDSIRWNIWDRESQSQDIPTCIGSPCPPRPLLPKLCQSTNVLEFFLPSTTVNDATALLGSENQLSVFFDTSLAATESGWGQIEFPEAATVNPVSGEGLIGMPVTGFAVQQFTNAGAAAGLLAQYGALFQHKYTVLKSDAAGTR